MALLGNSSRAIGLRRHHLAGARARLRPVANLSGTLNMDRPYSVSCHCGAIRLSVDAELSGLEECNCSTCGRSGFVHWKVPVDAVRLITQKRMLATYLWRDAD